MGRLVRYDFPNNIHFVTTSCHGRLPLFNSDKVRTIFVQSVIKVRNKYRFKLFGYVIMPEHVHLLIRGRNDKTVSDIMREIKQTCGYHALQSLKVQRRNSTLEKLKRKIGGRKEQRYRFWKPRFYDFNVYSVKKFKEKLDYCHKNPVTRGLVNDPSEWIFSSYRNYYINDDSTIPIDHLETPSSAQG